VCVAASKERSRKERERERERELVGKIDKYVKNERLNENK
jgi:hypothetical protein